MDLASIGAIASGVGKVFGLFGGGKRKTGTDFVQLRKDAEKAGFNPAFALSATGAQGYGRGGQLSSLETLGGALDAVGETVRDLDPIIRETQELELELAREELRQARAMTALALSQGGPLGETGVRTSMQGPGRVQTRGPLTDPKDGLPDQVSLPASGTRSLRDGTVVNAPYGDDPLELETDWYTAFTEGDLVPHINRQLERNFPGLNDVSKTILEHTVPHMVQERRAREKRDVYERDKMIREAERKRFDPFTRDAYRVFD